MTSCIGFLLVQATTAVLLLCPIADAQSNCNLSFWDQPFEAKQASAALFANYFERSGSLSFESKAIFTRAEKVAGDIPRPNHSCPKGCQLRHIPYFLFQSAAAKLQSEYSDRSHCQALFESTSAQPIEYESDEVSTVDELSDWIAELSQGDGPQGEDLYQRCDKSCSPQYEYLITKRHSSDTNYVVKARVVCGHARDKGDSTYQLDSAFRWVCEKAD